MILSDKGDASKEPSAKISSLWLLGWPVSLWPVGLGELHWVGGVVRYCAAPAVVGQDA